MKTQRERAANHETGPVLAAAVGLGDITLDAVVIRPGRTLRVGAGRGCDLPFTCAATDVAFRDGASWVVGVPEGASIPGASEATRMVRLQDWNPGVTITDGDAWMRIWPTRGERFAGGPGVVRSTASSLGRALPVMWLALSLTLAVGTFGVWVSGVLGGGSGSLSLGEGGGRGMAVPERFATFGDGELGQTGEPSEVWISIPLPADDAAADEDDATEIEQPDDAAETDVEPERSDDPADDAAVAAPALQDDALAVETEVAQPTETAAGGAKKTKTAGARGDDATAEGGASGFGFGGGTDDGYSDRNESIEALEYSLASCMQGRHTHKVTLAVNTDGRLQPGSLAYAQGWTSEEQACVARAVEDWAFPAGDDSYEISLRVRKSSGGRA